MYLFKIWKWQANQLSNTLNVHEIVGLQILPLVFASPSHREKSFVEHHVPEWILP
jgi:hypothetical protein